ncbi:MAG: hypothetical protein P1P88_10950 [Bacteroidales bacterium]|nr:hypothetical protein [Bacteroidales bacterium]
MTIIGIAVVFPIVFSIGGAYNRRETALKHYASLKAHGRAIFFASRDWVPKTDAAFQSESKEILRDLMRSVRNFLHAEIEEHVEKENVVYSIFSRLSIFIKSFRERELPSGEVSRSNQYLSKMMDAFESLKHIYQYRTPVTLRAYSKIFMFLVPILYGPYFEYIAGDLSIAMQMVMPVLLSIVLVSLDNIQDHLENPYDQVGEDDVQINAEKFIDWLDS